MSEPEILLDILDSVLIAIDRIQRRFHGIQKADDFMASDDGIDRMDGIAMMLIAIGEQVKRLDRRMDSRLDILYPEIDWRGVKGIRDILSHHYFSADAEIVFDVCQNKISSLKHVILKIRDNCTDPFSDH